MPEERHLGVTLTSRAEQEEVTVEKEEPVREEQSVEVTMKINPAGTSTVAKDLWAEAPSM